MPKRITTAQFIEKAKLIHGDIYDYSNVVYENSYTKVKIGCGIHGEFEQTPNSHLSKKGCFECGKDSMANKQTLTTAQFIEKAKLKHGDKYDYSNVVYENNSTKVKIICKEHEVEFEQTSKNHIKNHQGCFKCFHKLHYSKMSIDWLNFISKKDNITIQHALNSGEYPIPDTRYKADGYCIETNTIYEFHGDYWHGNPLRYSSHDKTYYGETFGNLYANTTKKEQQIRDLGYILIVIWESDWIKLNKCVRILQQKYKNSKLI